jgi:hypothetical protein
LSEFKGIENAQTAVKHSNHLPVTFRTHTPESRGGGRTQIHTSNARSHAIANAGRHGAKRLSLKFKKVHGTIELAATKRVRARRPGREKRTSCRARTRPLGGRPAAAGVGDRCLGFSGWSLARGRAAKYSQLPRPYCSATPPPHSGRRAQNTTKEAVARPRLVARLVAPDTRNSCTSLFNSPVSPSRRCLARQADPEPCAWKREGFGRRSEHDGDKSGDPNHSLSFLLRVRTRNGKPVGLLAMRVPNSTCNFDLTDQ